jgi:predicted outer membrane repeat protein
MKIGTTPSVSSPPIRFLVVGGFLLLSLASSSYADVFRNYTLDSDPLWDMTAGSQWAFGVPQGLGGSPYGNPDPTAGHTGANVYGVNLNGDYNLTVGGPWYLTTGPIDCRRHANVHLKFWRWLNTDYQPYVYATVEVSNNGSTWTTIWNNPANMEIADSTWIEQDFDISAQADYQPNVYIRWGYQVNSEAYAYSGWNLDDIRFEGEYRPIYNQTQGLGHANIQGALSAAVNGDVIVVADGIYTGTGNRNLDFGGKTVTLRSAGGADKCIIDCQGNSSEHYRGFWFHNGENSDSILDGFTIQTGFENSGGGIYCENSSSPTIINCKFRQNYADWGGGAIYCYANSDPFITDCVFDFNIAGLHGGAIHCHTDCDPWIRRCTFIHNNSGNVGGALSCFTNCNAIVSFGTFTQNTAEDYGGGIFCYQSSHPRFISCTLTDNTAANGGGVYTNLCDTVLTNCLIADNDASQKGGGIDNVGGNPIITNCTIVSNTAGTLGGGFACEGTCSPQMVNSILYANAAAQGDEVALRYHDCVLTVSYSSLLPGSARIYTEGSSYVYWGYGNNTLYNPTLEFTSYRLRKYSPCIDAGDNSAVPADVADLDEDDDTAEPTPLDIDKQSRFLDAPKTDTGNGTAPFVDMGAYEYYRILYVDTDATGANDGEEWHDAFTFLQDALNDARSGDQIWVAEGTYKPDQGIGYTLGDRTATFQLKNGVAIYGGFIGNEISLSERNVKGHQTILSGDLADNDGPDFTNYDENSIHVVTGSDTNASAIIDGFTITAGYADGVFPEYSGGGLYNYFGSPTVANCTFIQNKATGRAGALFNHTGAPLITNCRFLNNTSPLGGALNNAYESHPSIINCYFGGNHASDLGGVMQNAWYSDPEIVNSTFVGNTSVNYGSVIRCWVSSPIVKNCIFWNNSGLEGYQISLDSSSIDVSYSDLQGGTATIRENSSSTIWGAGNINANPLFEDADGTDNQYGTEDDNVHLASGSPCIDAGNNDAVPPDLADLDANNDTIEPTPFDLDNFSRRNDDLDTFDTGNGSSPIVDMGAHERNQILFVNDNAPGGNNGVNWYDAFSTLQQALDQAQSGDQIWVAEGIYWPDRGPGRILGERTATFQLKNGVALYGGFTGTETSLDQRSWKMYETILSGDLADNDGPDFANYDENCYHVVTGSGTLATAVLDGFIIESGNADGDFPDSCGGGMLNLTSSPTISHCKFRLNWADDDGGGMYNCERSSPGMTDCMFIANQAAKGGGMASVFDCHLNMTDCVFYGNIAYIPFSTSDYGGQGGGMFNDFYGEPVLTRCTFENNFANGYGGGMYNSSGAPTVIDCDFLTNVASTGGGIFNDNSSEITMQDCTVIGNAAENLTGYDGQGGGMYISHGNTIVNHCLFEDNHAAVGGGAIMFISAQHLLFDSTMINNFPNAFDGQGSNQDKVQVQVEKDLVLVGNDWVGSDFELFGTGSLVIDSTSTVNLPDAAIRCNLKGTGLVQIDLGAELLLAGDALIDLSDDDDHGAILCEGLLRVKDNVQIQNTNIYVTRASFEGNTTVLNSVVVAESGVPYGQFFIEDSVTVIGNDIHADGDRYLDLDPSVFAGLMQDNRIYVTITEGVGQTRGGLLELRGQDGLVSSTCDPNQFFCPIPPGTTPGCDQNSWTIEELKLVDGAKLNLTNRFDFHPPYDAGGDEEVLYVKNLIVGKNALLNTAYNRIYCENFTGEPNAIRNEPLLGFSLNNIAMDDQVEFLTRISHNNYIDPDPDDAYKNRIHIERITGLAPDPNGIMQMRNLIDKDYQSPTYQQVVPARAKALFAKAGEEEIFIQFEYLFCSADGELVIYLTDVPELLDHADPDRPTHYLEVARITAPPTGRPGAPDSGRFGIFRRPVPRRYLDFIRGTRMEFELTGPEDTCIWINNWDPWVYCAYCMDTDGEMGVTATDYLTVAGEYGKKSSDLNEFGQLMGCLDSILCNDGYLNMNDLIIWDWLDQLSENVGSLCFQIPLSSTNTNPAPGFNSSPKSLDIPTTNDGISGISAPLLIAGKRYHRYSTWEADYLSDRLYGFDENGNFLEGPFQLSHDRVNSRLVRDARGELYQLNLRDGLVRLSDEHPVIEPGSRTYKKADPWYGQTNSTVHIGLQGENQDWWGRPLLDVAFDNQGHAYVVPVVVEPPNHESYLAAAKLVLDPNDLLSYGIEQLYAYSTTWNDNLDPNHLREIEVDTQGDVYFLNSNDINWNDILWVSDAQNQQITSCELQNPNIGIHAPVALCLSQYDSTVYMSSSQNEPSATSVYLYAFPRESLPTPDPAQVKTIRIDGMGHVTGITEDPATGALWVVGFTIPVVPQYIPIGSPPFYQPYLAKIPYGSTGPISAVNIGSQCNLSMPLSIVFTGSGDPCGGADLDGNGLVNLPDLHILMNHWLQDNTDPDWLQKADLDNSNSIDLADFAIMGQFWLKSGCQNP